MKYFFTQIVAIVLALSTMTATAQTDGFSYQAVVRNAAGELVSNSQVGLRLTLTAGQNGKVVYQETHAQKTNSFGVLSVTVGAGTPADGQSLSNVNWASGDVWMRVEVDPRGGSEYTDLGATKLQSVPYAYYAATGGKGEKGDPGRDGMQVEGQQGQTLVHNGTTWVATDEISLKKLDVKGGTVTEDALFEVKDKDGNVVFAVYPNGVHVYIDPDAESSKVRRSGFLITGRDANKDGENNDFFSVDGKGTQVFVDGDNSKVRRSGFLITGRDATKDGQPNNYLTVDDEGTKVFIDNQLDDNNSKVRRSGFLITGRDATKEGEATNYMKVATDGTQIKFDADASKVRRSGFLITGRDATKAGSESDVLEVTPDSTRVYIGIEGKSGDDKSGFAVTEKGYAGKAGYMNVTPKNFFAGYDAGKANTGQYNTYIGNEAGKKDTVGEDNVYIGNSAGINGSGSENVFIGCNSGPDCSGTRNVFVGWHSGRLATTAESNVIIGNGSGDRNKTGNENVLLGNSAGYNNNGNQNVFIGNSTFRMHTIGDHNIAIGDGAGDLSDSSNYCIVIGYDAGRNSKKGENNVVIGTQAGYKYRGNNNVFIGNKAGYNEEGSNRLYIANSSSNPLIYGEFDNKIVKINGAQVSTSDQRFKENIQTLKGSLQKISGIRGVSFTWKTNAEINKIKGVETDSDDGNKRLQEGTQLGVIAQEVEAVVPEVVYTDDKGFKSVDYIKLTPVLIEAMKELKNEKDELEKKNNALEAKVERLEKMMEELMKK